MDLTPDDPPQPAPAPAPQETSAPAPPADPMATIVPYKNPKALTSYYLGLFSPILPFVGLFTGIAALVLGIQGVKFNKQFPETKGKVHAGIGIGCGTLGVLINLLIAGSIIAAIVSAR